MADTEENFLQRLPQQDPTLVAEKLKETQLQDTQRSALDRFTFDGLLYESEVFHNSLAQLEEKFQAKKGRKNSKRDAIEEKIYNPHENSEDEEGTCFTEIISMINQSRNCSQLTSVNISSQFSILAPEEFKPKQKVQKVEPKMRRQSEIALEDAFNNVEITHDIFEIKPEEEKPKEEPETKQPEVKPEIKP